MRRAAAATAATAKRKSPAAVQAATMHIQYKQQQLHIHRCCRARCLEGVKGQMEWAVEMGGDSHAARSSSSTPAAHQQQHSSSTPPAAHPAAQPTSMPKDDVHVTNDGRRVSQCAWGECVDDDARTAHTQQSQQPRHQQRRARGARTMRLIPGVHARKTRGSTL